jgi:TPP-dependent trihydroxycyclohexane-1,2-dione (THcHDO) dehydratase
MFECDGKPYRVDFAAMARAMGARGHMITAARELGGALRRSAGRERSHRHPGPDGERAHAHAGHWNINDIYRKGR